MKASVFSVANCYPVNQRAGGNEGTCGCTADATQSRAAKAGANTAATDIAGDQAACDCAKNAASNFSGSLILRVADFNFGW